MHEAKVEQETSNKAIAPARESKPVAMSLPVAGQAPPQKPRSHRATRSFYEWIALRGGVVSSALHGGPSQPDTPLALELLVPNWLIESEFRVSFIMHYLLS